MDPKSLETVKYPAQPATTVATETPKTLREQQVAARTRAELIALATERGYHDPEFWADVIVRHRARMRRRK